MAGPESTCASLRFYGDDLDLDQISKTLARTPDRAESKGDVLSISTKGVKRIADTGLWQPHAPEESDGPLDGQIRDLLGPLTDDLAVWRDLASRYTAEMYCGIFMNTGNDELGLHVSTLRMLSDRELRLEFDIYQAVYD